MSTTTTSITAYGDDHDIRVIGNPDGDLVYLDCLCGWVSPAMDAPTPATLLSAELAHLAPRRIGVRLNANLNERMTRGKAAAQAIHAVLKLLGVTHEGAVVVLGGSPEKITAMPVVIHDAGRTELEPGTLTAGATWLAREEQM